jgi:chloramphenicol-sensitive protein RarD
MPQQMALRFGLLAYITWGFFPLYFHLMAGVPVRVIMASRVVGAAIFFVGLMLVTKKLGFVSQAVLRSGRRVLWLALGALLIGLNWTIWVWTLSVHEIVQSSFGYYLVPLLNILCGYLFFSDRLKPIQKWALIWAALSLVPWCLRLDHIPYFAIGLAVTFALYGLVKKAGRFDPLVTMTFESLFLIVPTLFFLRSTDAAQVPVGVVPLTAFLGVGFLTGLVLLWFAKATQGLTLSTIGFLQYITPTMHFIFAITIMGEGVDHYRAAGFGILAIGLLPLLAHKVRHG